MGSIISSKSNNISIDYSGMKSGLKGGASTISTSNVGGYGSNGVEEFDFDNVSLSLREYSTIQFNPITIELYVEGLLKKKSELQDKLAAATSTDEILRLQKEIFMIDFNIYMLNNQKKLNMYQDIANSEEFKNYMAAGSVSLDYLFLIESVLNEKGSISWDDDSKWMYSYIFETQGKDAANEYYDVVLDIVNRQKGLSSADGMISLTNNSSEVASSFMPSASKIFNNGGVLTSKEYTEMYALIYYTKAEGTYETTMNSMSELMSGIVVNSGSNKVPLYKQTDYPDVEYAGGTVARDGCGITCAAMLISYFKGRECSVPELAGKFSKSSDDSRYRMLNALDSEGISYQYADKWAEVREAVKEGHTAIVIVDSDSGLTGTEHFIVVSGINEEGRFIVNDPNYDINIKRSWENQYNFENGFVDVRLELGWSGGYIIEKKDNSPVELNFMDSYNSMLGNYGLK